VTCPHCKRAIPDRAVLSEAARLHSKSRIVKRGRQPVIRLCPRCGGEHSAREMRKCKVPSSIPDPR
jgi:riboflavin biosynthesis pyrimidine reductase